MRVLVPSDRSVGMFIRRCLVAIDLTYAPEVVALIEKTRDFTRNVVLPIEDEHAGDIAVAGGDAIRIEMQAAASRCLRPACADRIRRPRAQHE
ncbi:hypothetical protein GCM10020255_017740 [Rhodococcus baikonurensis]